MLGAKEIKLRIKGVKNIQQITRAMQMVAVAKLKKVQAKALASRPYEYKLQELLKIINHYKKPGLGLSHPLFKKRTSKRIGLLIISSEQGLCGAYNTNILQYALKFINDHSDKEPHLTLIGKKAHNFFKKKNFKIREYYPLTFKEITIDQAERIVNQLIKDYLEELNDEIYLFFTRFETVMHSIPTHIRLLPLEELGKAAEREYIFEPSAEEILISLLPRYLKLQVYKGLIESMTSEQGARMVAMRSATDNGEEVLSGLILSYNRARQSAITKEILEVASGAEALEKR